MVQFAAALIAGIAVGLTGLLATPAKADADFEFYVLALSWSPSYCATDDDPSVEECSVDRGFVVHGLWPQYERGYPEYCSSSQPRWLEQDVIDDNRDIFPSKDLAIHQWRKHGMCAGLDQDDYFDLIREASETVIIPPAFAPGDRRLAARPPVVEELFKRVNEGLTTDAMSVQCDEGLLTEVRICLTKDLAFRSCDEVDERTCRREKVAVPEIR